MPSLIIYTPNSGIFEIVQPAEELNETANELLETIGNPDKIVFLFPYGGKNIIIPRQVLLNSVFEIVPEQSSKDPSTPSTT